MTEALRPRVTEINEPAADPEPPQLSPRIIADEGVGQMEIGEQPITPTEPAVASEIKGKTAYHRAIALGCIAFLILGLLILNTADFLFEKFHRDSAFGIAYLLVVAVGVVGGLYWLAIEWRALRSLRAIDQLRQELGARQVTRKAADRQIMQSLHLLQRDPRLRPACESYTRSLSEDHSGEDAINLFATIVLRQADELAKSVVSKAALQAFGIVAISPTAITDTILFLARGLGMIRSVASIYGQRPTFVSTLYLMKHLLGNASLVGAADLAGSAVLEQIGGDLFGKISATTAQSLLAAQRTARLGLMAMQLCRPVEFKTGEMPGLADLIPRLRG